MATICKFTRLNNAKSEGVAYEGVAAAYVFPDGSEIIITAPTLESLIEAWKHLPAGNVFGCDPKKTKQVITYERK